MLLTVLRVQIKTFWSIVSYPPILKKKSDADSILIFHVRNYPIITNLLKW